MLFQRLPITPSSGSGIHAGQKTGAWMRLASRCQPAAAFAGQRSFADALTESFAPQPASAKAASARSPSRFTAPLKPGIRLTAALQAKRLSPPLRDHIGTTPPQQFVGR